jgi:hypothetical protein
MSPPKPRIVEITGAYPIDHLHINIKSFRNWPWRMKSNILRGLQKGDYPESSSLYSRVQSNDQNITTHGATTGHLARLPNELLLHIMEQMPSPGALYNFMKACPRSAVVAQSHPKPQEVLMGVIQRLGIPLQLHNFICITLAVRHSIVALAGLERYLETNLEGISIPSIVACGKDLVGMLQDLVTLFEDIDTLEETFLTIRLENAVQLQRVRQSCAYDSKTVSKPAASPTELHRIRRAFWRLQLYSDLYHHPGRRSMAHDWGINSYRRKFLLASTVWEHEELECAYYHVKDQLEVWRDSNSARYAPALAHRLLERFQCDKDNWDPSDRPKSRPESHISYAVFHRPDFALHVYFNSQSRTAWADTLEACEPSAGYQYFKANSEEFGAGMDSYFHTSPLSCFLDWGFCMWDRSRLETLQLLGCPSQHSWADPNKSHRYGWLHCHGSPAGRTRKHTRMTRKTIWKSLVGTSWLFISKTVKESAWSPFTKMNRTANPQGYIEGY